MISALLTSLAVAFISGMTFLAYTHPIAFKRLYWPICFLISVSYIATAVWNGAISTVLATLKDFIPPPQFQTASAKAHELDFQVWYIWVFLASVIYMVFLLWLPNLLKEDSDKTKPKDE